MNADKPEHTLADFIVAARIGYLTTIRDDGKIMNRPVGIPQKEYDKYIWLITNKDSNKITHIRANPQISLSFSTDDAWVAIAGTAEITTDTAIVHTLWSPINTAFFDGPDDPQICLLKIIPSSATCWSTANGKRTSLLTDA